jgi:hypothetical protein
MTDKLQEGEWETEKETLASRGNGQYEPYLVVSKDEADARVAELEAENQRLIGCCQVGTRMWNDGSNRRW